MYEILRIVCHLFPSDSHQVVKINVPYWMYRLNKVAKTPRAKMHSKGEDFPNRIWTQVPDKILYKNKHSTCTVPTAQSTYICRIQSCVWRLPKYWTLPPLHPPSVSSPTHRRRGGTQSPSGEGVGGQYFGRRQKLNWPLTIISLRPTVCSEVTPSVMDFSLMKHKLLVQGLLQKEPFLNTDSSPDNKLRKKP
jgi:hypothetical protein